MPFLGLILNWLGGGVLTSVLSHLEKRKELELGNNKLQAEITITEIRAELDRRNAQKEVLLKESESLFQWLPRFLIAMSVALYITSIFIDSIFDLPGVVLAVPDKMDTIISVVIGALFLDAGATKISRALRR